MFARLRYLLGWILSVFRCREDLVLENVALRQQLQALHAKRPRPRLSVLDNLPEGMLRRVRNITSFAGVLALDKWTCNADGRQVAFWRRPRERKFNASFIDQGYFFNAGEWSFPDAPLRGVFGRNDVYASVTGWDSFEPWLSRIKCFPESSLWPLVDQIPPEWYGSAADELDRLLTDLLDRRSRVRELILSFKDSSRNPFPNWRDVPSVAAATSLRPRGQ